MRRLKFFRCRGESLLEIVVAVTILATVLTSIFTLLIQTASSNANLIHRVVALNLAREGVEAVRNIRDTNWLKYSGDRRNKWLCLDTVTTPNACSTATALILEGVYRVEYSVDDSRYFLEKDISTILTEKKTLPTEDFRLYEGTTGTEEGRVFHVVSDGETLPFYRQIFLNPEEESLNSTCSGLDCPKDIRLNVVVRVQWKDGNSVRHLDLETYLYDFLGRESY